MESGALRELLTLLLAIANYMNKGTFRANLCSFTVESLLLLNDTRGKGVRCH